MTPIKLNISFDNDDSELDELELISGVLEKNVLSFEQAVTLLYEVILADPNFASKLIKSK